MFINVFLPCQAQIAQAQMLMERHAESKNGNKAEAKGGKAAVKSWRRRHLESDDENRSRGIKRDSNPRGNGADAKTPRGCEAKLKRGAAVRRRDPAPRGADNVEEESLDFIADEDDDEENDDDDVDDSRGPILSASETTPLTDPRRHHLRQFLRLFVTSLKPQRKFTQTLTLNKRKEPRDDRIKRYIKKGYVFHHLKWLELQGCQ